MNLTSDIATIVGLAIVAIFVVIVIFAFISSRRRRVEPPFVFRIIKWLILLFGYFAILSWGAPVVLMLLGLVGFGRGSNLSVFSQTVSASPSFPYYLLPLFILSGWMSLIAWVYTLDRAREQKTSDDFKGDNLFSRYGYRFNEMTISIFVKPEWTDQEIRKFVEAMRQKIALQTQTRFSASGVQTTTVWIHDKVLPADTRTFIKIVFRSRRGSQVSDFIYYAMAGRYVVVHFLSYIRGEHFWHDVVDFIITSPLSVWFWGVRWLQNGYNITTSISRDLSNNSYDELDLETYLVASVMVWLDETKKFLEEQGLLTPELKQMIFNNINNSQNIAITGSHDIKLGNVRNSVRTPYQPG